MLIAAATAEATSMVFSLYRPSLLTRPSRHPWRFERYERLYVLDGIFWASRPGSVLDPWGGTHGTMFHGVRRYLPLLGWLIATPVGCSSRAARLAILGAAPDASSRSSTVSDFRRRLRSIATGRRGQGLNVSNPRAHRATNSPRCQHDVQVANRFGNVRRGSPTVTNS
jgi:hypothetical protein